MSDENAYNVITESLQSDINDEKITYEYASIVNDIAYKIYVENVKVNDGIRGIMEKYINTSVGINNTIINDAIYVSSLQEDINANNVSYEYAQVINSLAHDMYINNRVLSESSYSTLFEYMIESTKDVCIEDNYYEDTDAIVTNITEAYENGEISSEEAHVLLEALYEKTGDPKLFTESGFIKGKIESSINEWKRTMSKGLGEVKKKNTGKTFDKKVIQKMGAAGAALAMALSQAGCSTDVAKKEVSKAEKQVHSINIMNADINNESILGNISDELRESIYNAINDYDTKNASMPRLDGNRLRITGAELPNGKKTLITAVSSKNPMGPVDVRRLEKDVISRSEHMDAMHYEKSIERGSSYGKRALKKAKSKLEKELEELQLKIKNTDDDELLKHNSARLNRLNGALKELDDLSELADKLMSDRAPVANYNLTIKNKLKKFTYLSDNLTLASDDLKNKLKTWVSDNKNKSKDLSVKYDKE